VTDNCYTGNVCWEPYNHMHRSISIILIIIGIVVIYKIFKKIQNKGRD